jgi:phosphohistidine phosphatase
MTGKSERSDGALHLILMRHAKSDWSDGSLSDHDRPLNHRGKRDAPNMARWLADQNLIPDLILVSSSQRTRETVALMTEIWNTEPDTLFREDLYHSSPEEIIGAVQCNGNDRQRVMVIAHNPGMTSLVSHFADDFIEMPTAAIAIFESTCDSWSDLKPATSMRLVEHKRPKELT